MVGYGPTEVFGTGSVGGKTRGLLRAAAELGRRGWLGTRVVIPEYWVIGADIWEQFVVANGLDRFAPGAENVAEYEEVRAQFLRAPLPRQIYADLERFLEHVHCPLAVRSSALLEDNPGYSFAGKYYTVFISNQGPTRARHEQLETAIKEVYASVYGPNATLYRRRRGLVGDSMAVILQRLVARKHGELCYPEIAGVGFSRNYRRWTERVRPEDGVLRLVFGLGTRCTGRGYARLASLTNPELRPEGHDPRDVSRYSQEVFDALDLTTGNLVSWNINQRPDIVARHPQFWRYAQFYLPEENDLRDAWPWFQLAVAGQAGRGARYVFSFASPGRRLPQVVETARDLFCVLETVMGGPVDIEFTYDTESGEFALVQVRPLSSYEEFHPVHIPDVPPERILLRGDRMLTNGCLEEVAYLVYVDPRAYKFCADKQQVARAIGEVNRRMGERGYILAGPGRWGSSNPEQGVPVLYPEVSHAGLLVELGLREESFIPELSYGTHFFADLEHDHVLYMPVFTHLPTNVYRVDWFNSQEPWETPHPVVKVYRGKFAAYLDGQYPQGIVTWSPSSGTSPGSGASIGSGGC